MKVFISWSGDRSKISAQHLRDWLPSVLQTVKPYFTPSDVEKGARWNTEIAKELEESAIGIFCLTRESLASQWLMFEAGAISKIVGSAHVCPILFGLTASDVSGPLSQFQATPFDKEEMSKLVKTINDQCSDAKLDDDIRNAVFEKWWPELEEGVTKAMEEHSVAAPEEVRSDRDILNEILSLARASAGTKKEVELVLERGTVPARLRAEWESELAGRDNSVTSLQKALREQLQHIICAQEKQQEQKGDD